MAHRRRTFVRGGKTVRETVWLGHTPTAVNLAAASTANLFGSLNAAAIALLPFTVIRSRGILSYGSDQTVASENFSAALGIAIVTQQASAIGVTAVPTPMTELDSDQFFVHQIMAGRFQFITGVGFHPQARTFLEYDSKAMRKVGQDDDLVLTLETSAVSAGMDILHAGRFLVKLH